ncbi:MAG: CBS domain-containing protein [Silvanigrellaceae bacterium]|nr:CBS domain-containing protein [Silvanigrellaceae bacterium]
MLVRDLMLRRVASVPENSNFSHVAEVLGLTGLNDLIFVNEGKMVGTISDGDVLRALMPDLEELHQKNISYKELNAHFIQLLNSSIHKPIKPFIVREPIILHPQDTIIKAVTIMLNKGIIRLPVVEGGICVGVIGRADINWSLAMANKIENK